MPWTGNPGQRGGHEMKVVRAQAGEGLAVRMKGLLCHGHGEGLLLVLCAVILTS